MNILRKIFTKVFTNIFLYCIIESRVQRKENYYEFS